MKIYISQGTAWLILVDDELLTAKTKFLTATERKKYELQNTSSLCSGVLFARTSNFTKIILETQYKQVKGFPFVIIIQHS